MAGQQAKFLEGNLFRHVTVMSLTGSVGLMAIFLVSLTGAVVDYTSLEDKRNRAQIALDSAALALWAMVTWLFPWIDTFLPDLLPEGDVTISET